MIGDTSLLTGLVIKHGGFVTYRNNNRDRIIGCSDIGVKGNLIIENVLLIEGLKHNLLSISQLCDKGLQVTFQIYALYPVYILGKHTLLVKELTMFTC